MPSENLSEILISLVVLFFSIGLHEFAHAKVADMAGDPTPGLMGRVTLNPLAHFDPLGAMMIVITSITGFGLGWGKPVMVNPKNMRNPRWDHFWSVAAGPITNFIIAITCAIILRLIGMGPSLVTHFLLMAVVINLSLGLFNLIPIGPLDGHWIVGAFLPESTRDKWYYFNRTTGSFLFLFLVLFGQMNGSSILFKIIGPPMNAALAFLLGIRI